jgi:hypothetical protein
MAVYRTNDEALRIPSPSPAIGHHVTELAELCLVMA